MKKSVQRILQATLGFDRYLYWFARVKIATLRWDKREGDFLHFVGLVSDEASVLDIGANIGIMTSLVARKCKRGTVHAFEPIPENVSVLRRICRGRANVRIHATALGESSGEIPMVMPDVGAVRMQGLSHVVHESLTDFSEGTHYSVPQSRLDDLKDVVGEGVDAIKIDVENFEQFVFRGALATLREFRPLVYCELWDNENREACFEIFRELDYRIQILVDGGLVDFDPNAHEEQNFFFVG